MGIGQPRRQGGHITFGEHRSEALEQGIAGGQFGVGREGLVERSALGRVEGVRRTQAQPPPPQPEAAPPPLRLAVRLPFFGCRTAATPGQDGLVQQGAAADGALRDDLPVEWADILAPGLPAVLQVGHEGLERWRGQAAGAWPCWRAVAWRLRRVQ